MRNNTLRFSLPIPPTPAFTPPPFTSPPIPTEVPMPTDITLPPHAPVTWPPIISNFLPTKPPRPGINIEINGLYKALEDLNKMLKYLTQLFADLNKWLKDLNNKQIPPAVTAAANATIYIIGGLILLLVLKTCYQTCGRRNPRRIAIAPAP